MMRSSIGYNQHRCSLYERAAWQTVALQVSTRRNRMGPVHLAHCQEAFKGPCRGQAIMNDHESDLLAARLRPHSPGKHCIAGLGCSTCVVWMAVHVGTASTCALYARRQTIVMKRRRSGPSTSEARQDIQAVDPADDASVLSMPVGADNALDPHRWATCGLHKVSPLLIVLDACLMLNRQCSAALTWSPVGRQRRRGCQHRRMWRMVHGSIKILRMQMSVSRPAAACAVPAGSPGCGRWVPVQLFAYNLQLRRVSSRRNSHVSCICRHAL